MVLFILDSKKNLVILDFDNTLIHETDTNKNIETVRKIKNEGMELCLATRNDLFSIEDELYEYGLNNLFTLIMADFRPKNYQIRHILWIYEKKGKKFDNILFIDDYEPNIELVRRNVPDVKSLIYGKDIRNLEDLYAFFD